MGAENIPVNEYHADAEEAALLAFLSDIEAGIDIRKALNTAIRRYPSAAPLLTDFAVMNSLNSAKEIASTALELRIIERGEALLEPRIKSNAPAISSLLAEIKAKGIDLADYAKSLTIGASVLVKLDRRLIDPETVPRRLTDAIALSLSIPVATLVQYFSSPPTLSPSASYRASKPPSLTTDRKRETFAHAMRTAVAASEIAAADAERWNERNPTHSE